MISKTMAGIAFVGGVVDNNESWTGPSLFGSYVFGSGICNLIFKHACKLTEYMGFFLDLSISVQEDMAKRETVARIIQSNLTHYLP